jgi:hypothetical protein
MATFTYACLILSAFASAFSLPAGRALLGVAALLTILLVFAEGRFPKIPRTVWIGLMFVSVAVAVTVYGVNPELGVPKLSKLLWFGGIAVMAALIDSEERLSGVLKAFALGTGVLALKTYWDSIRVCLEARPDVDAGTTSYYTAILNAGSITDGQRYMVGIAIVLGMIYICKQRRWTAVGWWILLAMQCVALLLTLKRGSWLCTCGIVALFIVLRMNWRYLIVMGICFLLLLLVPFIRGRLMDTMKEFSEGKGGRVAMWTKIAPVLIKERTWVGQGYRSLTNERMREIDPTVEPNRDHLHSNPVQVLVATGVLGFILYLLWMASGVVDIVRFFRASSRDPVVTQTLAVVVLLMFVGLLINGLVEYNIGDAEIVLIYGIVMGSAAAGARWGHASAASRGMLH